MLAQLCVTYPFGSTVRISAVFTRPPTDEEIEAETAADADDWQLTDPTTVIAKTKAPSGNVDTYDYLGSPLGELVRGSLGLYYVDLAPAESGTWYYRFEATGEGAAAGDASFKVAESVFYP